MFVDAIDCMDRLKPVNTCILTKKQKKSGEEKKEKKKLAKRTVI